MNKTLKEQFLADMKQGTMIDVTYITYERETFVKRFCYVNNTFYNLETTTNDENVFIDMNDIAPDLEIFNPEFKYVSITRIIEPTQYNCLFDNPTIVYLTQAEIEKILGYKIKIIKE